MKNNITGELARIVMKYSCIVVVTWKGRGGWRSVRALILYMDKSKMRYCGTWCGSDHEDILVGVYICSVFSLMVWKLCDKIKENVHKLF